jgi:thiol-disulfide isomerase/thioredoxin
MRIRQLTILCLGLMYIATAMAGVPAYPKFELYSMENSRYTSLQQRGRAVLIVFFARQCLPCRMEVPFLNDLSRKFPDTLTILGIAFMENDYHELKALIRNWGIKYPVIPDPDARVADAFNNFVFPHSFLMDHTGKIIADYPGFGKVYNKDLLRRLADLAPKIKEYRSRGPSFHVAQFSEGRNSSGLGSIWQKRISSILASDGVRVSPSKRGADYVISGDVQHADSSIKVEIFIYNSGGVEEMRFSEVVKSGKEGGFGKLFTEKLKAFPYVIRHR